MKLKRYIEFINESVSIHEGDFRVTSDMVSNGKMIKEKIPREVIGDFHCSNLKLTSLEGCPKKVGGYFHCQNNLLLSLEGSPESVGRSFYCNKNLLTSLSGCAILIGKSFSCSNNKLKSLEGGPELIHQSYWCHDNQLSSLVGGPKKFNNIIYVNMSLKIEKAFIESGKYINEYWMDLLKYMIDNHINLEGIKTWPKDFLNDNMIQSVKGLNKFKL